MHVEGFSRSRLSVFLWGPGILLIAAVGFTSGCTRPTPPDVMATVNGKEITRSELDKYYKSNVGDAPQEPSSEQADIVRLQILRTLIDDEIVQQRAAKLNLSASDEDVNAKLTEMKLLSTQEEFDSKLKQRGITLEDLKRDIRRELTRTKLVNKEIESKINITDAEITDYYKANKSEFNFIEPRYRLAQIVVTGAPIQQGTNLQRRTPNEAEARKLIQNLHSRLESGEDFAALASQYSENANSAPNGGDMGFFTETQLRSGSDPEIYNAITHLKPGQVTDVLPMYDSTGPGRKVGAYAIYKLLSRESAGQREFNDPRTQQQIRQTLRDRKAQLLQSAYFEMLRDQATVRNYFAEQILKKGAQ